MIQAVGDTNWCVDGVISGIGVVYVAMGVESFERGIELSNENEKLGKGYWVFVIFFARICN